MKNYKKRIEYIKNLMRNKGFKRMQDLANSLDMLPNTLSSSINYLTKSQNYNTAFAKKLCNALDIEVNIFIKEITNQTDEASSLSLIRDRGEYLSKIFNSYQNEITEIILNLKDGDVYTLVTTESPWEHSKSLVKTPILEAIKQGVKFQYIYPLVSTVTISKLHLFKQGNDWKYLESLHNDFIEDMLNLSKKDKEFNEIKLYKANPEKFIKESLSMYLTDELLLTHPLFKFILIETEVYGGEKKIAFVEGEVGLSQDMSKEYNYWYPLPTEPSNILFNNVELIIDNYKKEF